MSKPVGASSLLAHAAIQSSLVLPGYSNLACGMVCCDGSFMVRVAFGTSFLDVGSRWLGPVHDHASRWLSPTYPDLYIRPFFPSFHCPDHIKVSVSRFLSFGCSGFEDCSPSSIVPFRDCSTMEVVCISVLGQHLGRIHIFLEWNHDPLGVSAPFCRFGDDSAPS